MMTESEKVTVEQVNCEWESVREFQERLRWSLSPSTLRNHLNRGVEDGVLECRYEGNGHRGRNMYRRKS